MKMLSLATLLIGIGLVAGCSYEVHQSALWLIGVDSGALMTGIGWGLKR